MFPSFPSKQIWIWKSRKRLCCKSEPRSGSGVSHPHVPQRWGPGQCHQKQAAKNELSLMRPESSAPAVTNKSLSCAGARINVHVCSAEARGSHKQAALRVFTRTGRLRRIPTCLRGPVCLCSATSPSAGRRSATTAPGRPLQVRPVLPAAH